MDERVRKTMMSVAIGVTIWGFASWLGTFLMSGVMSNSMGGLDEMGSSSISEFILLAQIFSPKLLLAIIGVYNIYLWKKPKSKGEA